MRIGTIVRFVVAAGMLLLTGCGEVVTAPEERKPTIPSFCGIVFGEPLVKTVPRVEAKVSEGAPEASYRYGEKRLERPFRRFETAGVRATWQTGRIYEVDLEYVFPAHANLDEAADRLTEYKQLIEAVRARYDVKGDEGPDFMGDRVFRCKLGDVELEVRSVSEGVIERSALKLKAINRKLEAQAQEESRAGWNARHPSREERQDAPARPRPAPAAPEHDYEVL